MAAQHPPIVIDAIAGNPTVKSVRIPPGGSIVVGRLPECDLADPNDLHLSRQHCRIEYRAPDCVLKNLSSNGTLVNGQSADQIKLRDGDRIECSRLALKVAFAKDEPPTQRVASAGVTTRRDRPGTYSAEPCRSGLVRYAGQQEHPGPREMLELLMQSGPVYAIIDFRRIERPVPESISPREYLFYWMPEEVAAGNSPLIFAAADLEEFPELIEQAWGTDAVICFASRQERTGVFEHLRAATGYRPNVPGGPVLGYCWPNMLSMLLLHQPQAKISHLTRGVDAVLMEDDESPGRWNIFADQAFASIVESAGLTRAAAELAGQPTKS